MASWTNETTVNVIANWSNEAMQSRLNTNFFAKTAQNTELAWQNKTADQGSF